MNWDIFGWIVTGFVFGGIIAVMAIDIFLVQKLQRQLKYTDYDGEYYIIKDQEAEYFGVNWYIDPKSIGNKTKIILKKAKED